MSSLIKRPGRMPLDYHAGNIGPRACPLSSYMRHSLQWFIPGERRCAVSRDAGAEMHTARSRSTGLSHSTASAPTSPGESAAAP
jgi:hypothetical protein